MKIINRSPGNLELEDEIFRLVAESETQGLAKAFRGESLKAWINSDLLVLSEKLEKEKKTENMGGYWKGNILTIGYKIPGKLATMISLEI